MVKKRDAQIGAGIALVLIVFVQVFMAWVRNNPVDNPEKAANRRNMNARTHEPPTLSQQKQWSNAYDEETQNVDAIVDLYRPENPGDVHDLESTPAQLFRGMPFQLELDIQEATAERTQRLIVIPELKFKSREDWRLLEEKRNDGKADEEVVERLYQKHRAQIRLLQLRQEIVLKCLVRQHKLSSLHHYLLPEEMLSNLQDSRSLFESNSNLPNNVRDRLRLGSAVKLYALEELPELKSWATITDWKPPYTKEWESNSDWEELVVTQLLTSETKVVVLMGIRERPLNESVRKLRPGCELFTVNVSPLMENPDP